MKKILLLRHAKAEPLDGYASDHDRGLAARGRRAADLLGAHMAASGLAPDEVFCSTAQRTLQTWRHVAAAGDFDLIPVTYSRELYEATVGRVLEMASRVQPASESVLFVGHEPTMSGTLRVLTGRMPGSFATCTLAIVRYDRARSWDEIEPGSGQVERLIEASMLESGPSKHG